MRSLVLSFMTLWALTFAMPVEGYSTLRTEQTYVYICTGEYAKAYHAYRDCQGLGNCRASIKKTTKAEAERNGRVPCKK